VVSDGKPSLKTSECGPSLCLLVGLAQWTITGSRDVRSGTLATVTVVLNLLGSSASEAKDNITIILARLISARGIG
jgi:hypothetical protein